MNKRGQLGFLSIIVFALLFILFFAFALAPFVSVALGVADLSQFGQLGMFLIGSFNIWIFLAFSLVLIMAIVYGVQK